MEWTTEGIVIGTRKHGETSVIVEIMTAEKGRHLGLVRGGRSRAMRPVLQVGNQVSATWRARLDEHLGTFEIEPIKLVAAKLMESACAIHGIQLLGSHLRLLPERDPHAGLYDALKLLIEYLDQPELAGPLMVRFEVRLLEELGFGLNLSQCAQTGESQGLAYVSPKSGNAVTKEVGTPWASRLLRLPAFLVSGDERRCDADDLADAFVLTGHFFDRNIYQARGISAPTTRQPFIDAAMKGMERDQAASG